MRQPQGEQSVDADGGRPARLRFRLRTLVLALTAVAVLLGLVRLIGPEQLRDGAWNAIRPLGSDGVVAVLVFAAAGAYVAIRKRRRRQVVVASLLALGLIWLGLSWALMTTAWIGRTRLEVRFEVRDRSDDRPIEGAQIAIQSTDRYGPPPAGPPGPGATAPRPQRLLNSDRAGTATVVVGAIAGGIISWWNREDRTRVEPPPWEVQISAPGYHSRALGRLEVYRRSIVRTAPGQHRMTIEVDLLRAPPAAGEHGR